MSEQPLMNADSLVALLELWEQVGIPVWLDGGWGVDALLERQTRPHKDVDIVVPLDAVPKLQAVLAAYGFAVSAGVPPHAFVLADGRGLEVDVHAVRFDLPGNGHYRMQNGAAWVYPAAGFAGRGTVAGHPVGCLTPAVQVLCHAEGYVPTAKDWRDMAQLAARFGLELPAQLRPPP